MNRSLPAQAITISLEQANANAAANLKFMRLIWWGAFTFPALLQIFLWPDKENIISVVLAWSSCAVTALVVLRSRVTVSHPWSAMLVLAFCLTTCGLPLVLLFIQGDPLTNQLEVPQQTFLHLFLCQLVLLIVHTLIRYYRLFAQIQIGLQNKVLQPLGFFRLLSIPEIMAIGVTGLAATVYVYLFLRDQQGGELMVTGNAFDKVAQGLSPLSYAPFLLVLPGIVSCRRNGTTLKAALTVVYSLGVLAVAMAQNARSYAFIGIAVAGVSAVLMLISGRIKIALRSSLILCVAGLLLIVVVGGDIAIAMRVARSGRADKSSVEMLSETFRLLTTERQLLKSEMLLITQGDDRNEAWYVTNPVFSRLVNTHFQDKALAIAFELGSEEKELLRQVEIQRVISTLPNPVIRNLNLSIDKNAIGAFSMGDWMEYLGGRKLYQTSGHGSGGFIGDGFAAYGWWYLLPFGFVALLLFVFADSLYIHRFLNKTSGCVGSVSFAIVGLINGYALAFSLTSESVSGLIGFVIRQPMQWLVLYGIVFWLVRFLVNMLTRKLPASAWIAIPNPISRLKPPRSQENLRPHS